MSDGVDYLYEDDSSGRLGIDSSGKAFRAKEQPEGPSIAGPTPRYGVGMAGSLASPAVAHKTLPAPPPERHLSPEELMALADEMESRQKAEHQAQMDRGPAVRQEGEPPQWLQNYMAKQPFTDPYHQVGVSRSEAISKNKYLTDKEKEEYLKR